MEVWCRDVVKIMAFATEIFILIHYTAMRLLTEVYVVEMIIFVSTQDQSMIGDIVQVSLFDRLIPI